MKYKVQIEEKRIKTIEVDADSDQLAWDIANDAYKRGMVTLEKEDIEYSRIYVSSPMNFFY